MDERGSRGGGGGGAIGSCPDYGLRGAPQRHPGNLQFRWDCIGAMGLNPMNPTPNFDQMAKRGVLFRHAISNRPAPRAQAGIERRERVHRARLVPVLVNRAAAPNCPRGRIPTPFRGVGGGAQCGGSDNHRVRNSNSCNALAHSKGRTSGAVPRALGSGHPRAFPKGNETPTPDLVARDS